MTYSELVLSRIGMKFGSRTIIKYYGSSSKYICECICGKKTVQDFKNIRRPCGFCKVIRTLKEKKEVYLNKKIGNRVITKVYPNKGSWMVTIKCSKGHEIQEYTSKLERVSDDCLKCELELKKDEIIGAKLGVYTALEYIPLDYEVEGKPRRWVKVRCDCGNTKNILSQNFKVVIKNCTCNAHVLAKEVQIFGKKYLSSKDVCKKFHIPIGTMDFWKRKSENVEEKIKNYKPLLKEIKPKYRIPEVKKTISNIFNIFRKDDKGKFHSKQKVKNELRYLDTIKDVTGNEHELKYFGMPCDGGEIKMLQEHCGVNEEGSMAIEYKMNTYQALLYAFKKLSLNIPIHKGDVNKFIKDQLEMDYQYMHLDYVSPLTRSAYNAVTKALNYSPAVLVTVQSNKSKNGLMNPRIAQNPATYKIFQDGIFPEIQGMKQLWSNEYIGKSTPMTTYCLTRL